MRLTFLGADHEVTGSCHYLQACGKNILVDCGMEQGNDVYENQELPIPAADVDYLLLTHAHIDHSGLIPLLYAKGFRGRIFTTNATKQLCAIAENCMLRGAHVTLVNASVSVEPPMFVDVVNVTSAAEMADVVKSKAAEQDIIIMTAAVADFCPSHPADEKIKKNDTCHT